jgi:hypothetical protein
MGLQLDGNMALGFIKNATVNARRWGVVCCLFFQLRFFVKHQGFASENKHFGRDVHVL